MNGGPPRVAFVGVAVVVSLSGLGGVGAPQPRFGAPAAAAVPVAVVDTGGPGAPPLPLHLTPSEDAAIGIWSHDGKRLPDDTASLPNGTRLPLGGYDDGHLGLVCQAQGVPVREVTGAGNPGVWDLVQNKQNFHGWVSDLFVDGTANRDFDSEIARCEDATPEVVPAL